MTTYLLKPGHRQIIGKAGEREDTAVAINVSAWLTEYPDGRGQIMVTAPNGTRVPLVAEVSDSLLTANVPETCTMYPGLYTYTAIWTMNGAQVLSVSCECMIMESELAKTWKPHTGAPDWAERIFVAAEVIENSMAGTIQARDMAADMAQNVGEYAAAAEAAQVAAETAQAGAEEAKQAAAESEVNIETILTNMDQTITDARNAMNGIEEQKDTMIASIASVAGQGTDTTLTQPGVAADAKVTGDELNDLKSILIQDINLASLWETGGISSSDGTNGTSTIRLRTTGYISKNVTVKPKSGYKFAIYAYSNGTYIGTWNGSTFAKSTAEWQETDISLGADPFCNYDIRLLFSKTSNANIDISDSNNVSLIIKTDITLSTYGQCADAGALNQRLQPTENTVAEIAGEITILHPVLSFSGYINASTGEVASSDYGKCTDYIDIGFFDRIDWNTISGNTGVARVAFYDSSKTYIPALVVNAGTSGTVDLSDNAYASVKFVRLSFYGYPIVDFSKFAGRLYKSTSIQIKTDTLSNLLGAIDPVNVLIFGDSITDCAYFAISDDKTTEYNMFGTNSYTDGEGQTIQYSMWPKLFEQYVPCTEIRNYARSGASYKDQPSATNPRNSLSYQMTLAINDLPNDNNAFIVDDFVPDTVIFALGTNDGQPNDTPADAYAKIVTDSNGIDIDATLAALDKSKFCEAVLWAYLTARKYFPFALILCVLPLQRMSDDYPIGNSRVYLAEIAQKYGGAVLVDGAFDSGIVKENNVKSGLGATLKDGLHPNEKGQNLLARLIISRYKSNYISDRYMNA